MFDRLKWLLIGTLRRQLILGLALTVATAMSLFVWDVTRQQQNESLVRQSHEAVALAQSVAVSSSVWVFSRDFSGLQEIIQGLSRYPNLRHAIVLDLNGQILAHSDPTRIGKYLTDLPHNDEVTILQQSRSLVDVATPIILANRQIGWVRIGLSRDTLNIRLAKIARSGVFFALISISISILIAFFSGRYLTRRLYAIQQVAEAVNSGVSWRRAVVPGDDEAAKLALQFNRMLDTLQRSRNQFEHLALNIPIGVYLLQTTQAGKLDFKYVSPRFCAILDVGADEVYRDSKIPFGAIHPDDLDDFLRLNQVAIQNCKPFLWEGRGLIHEQIRWLHIESVPEVQADGDCIWDGIVSDITERKQAEEALLITASVFDNTQEAVLITDANNLIIETNAAFSTITGYSRAEVIGKNPNLLSSGRQNKEFYAKMWESLNRDRAWRGEIWNRRKSGDIYAEMLSISALCDHDGKVIRYVAVFSDITHIKTHEEELSHVAHYDALTNIPNRVLLADRMKQSIAQTAREQNMMAVCYLDLDGFKPINDTFGHESGDQVLVVIAERIASTIRGADTIARLGGDEFVALLLGLERGEECVATLERLLAAISHPIAIKGKYISLSASIGVSIYPLDNDDPDTLLRHADQAMYIAKQSGKNRFHIYDPELDKRARDQHEFIKSIRYGLENNQFELYYQPKVNLQSRELVGAEALIRWRHPVRGLLPPSEFLHHIENTDLDIEVGEWVTATALTQLNYWHSNGLDIEVSINISGYHMESTRFADNLLRQLALYPGMPPGKLQIEVLETVALNDITIVRGIIESCRKIGVGFALDDFGTGYSSLSYLSSLPVDALKIDQSFVRDMLEDKGDMAIVQGIIALARAFGRQTVAEGIETMEHYQVLRDMGCELGQGYGIARPMPADEIKSWKAGHVATLDQ